MTLTEGTGAKGAHVKPATRTAWNRRRPRLDGAVEHARVAAAAVVEGVMGLLQRGDSSKGTPAITLQAHTAVKLQPSGQWGAG